MTNERRQVLHFLVAVDGSDHSLTALRWITQMGGARGLMRCTVLNVQKPIMAGEVGVLAPASLSLDQRDRSAADILAQAESVMQASGVPFHLEDRIDDAAEAIHARAEALGCDAIVMGRRGLGAVRGALLGSVSAEVIRRSSLPVIVVNTMDAPAHGVPMRLLMAADGSPSALRAATFTTRLASLCQAEVDLVHVGPGITVAGAILGSRDMLVEAWSGKAAKQVLAEARSVLDSEQITCTEHAVASDDIPGAIVKIATEQSSGLIVMGTRGLGPVTGLLLGSVAQRVLDRAPPTVSAVVLVR